MREIKIGSIYKHFKNKYYIVLDIVNDCESNNDAEYKKIVIYRALYGKFLTWARPYEMFASEVDHEKYPDIKQKYRFEEVDIDCYMARESLQTHNIIMDAEIHNLAIDVRRLRIYELFSVYKESAMSLDEILCAIYREAGFEGIQFEEAKDEILCTINVNEIQLYLTDVNENLIDYVESNIFHQYGVNDKAHGIVHIREVIRRALALNDTFKLNLNANMIYAAAAYHDLGKHENHKIHEKIAARRFLSDDKMREFFSDEEMQIIADAIEDHRSSKNDCPRSIYGKLLSSADRNTSIDMVFIRSFFVAHERMPNVVITDYLDYTIERLSKKYSEEKPENMFFEDETYIVFLKEMRELLKKPDEFKDRYCEINNIDSRNLLVRDCPGFVE